MTHRDYVKSLFQGGAKGVRNKFGIGSWNMGSRLGIGIPTPGNNVPVQPAVPYPPEGLAGGGPEVMAKASDFLLRWWMPWYHP